MLGRNSDARTNFTVTAGPLFDAEHKMVLFSPSTERGAFTDPSYHLPAFYELWARWGPPADSNFWMDAAAASRDFFPRVANPVTGLAPDYANFDGTIVSNRWNQGAVNFRFDAFRTAGNWSVDWSWWGKDARERELSDKLQAFFESKGMDTYGCQFTLDGKQLDDRHAQGLVAVNADASLAATNPRSKKFVEALVEHADAGWHRTLLRRIAVHDGAAALQRRIPYLGIGMTAFKPIRAHAKLEQRT